MIITQLSDKVNTFTEKKKSAIIIGNKLISTRTKELIKRGYRMIQCSTELQFKVCKECGETHIHKTNLCRDRLCPVCSWRLSLKRYAVMLQIVQLIDIEQYDAAFLTLTIRNCKAKDLEKTIKAMSKAFSNLTKLKLWKNVDGFAKSVEVTYNKETKTMHPHLHILLLLEKGTYNNFILEDLKENWRRLLKIDYNPVIDLREVKSYNDNADITGAVLETFKYAVKSKDLEDMPINDFRTFAFQMNGLRLISFGGILKDIKQALCTDLDNLSENEETDVIKCKNCGSDMQIALYQWSFGEQYYKLLQL